mgnify:CR=1 FL=1
MVRFDISEQLDERCYSGWLGEVVEDLQEDTEWPRQLILESAAVELGLAVGRHRHLWYFGDFYANLYVVGISPPGEAHKTAIEQQVARIARNADTGARPTKRVSIASAEGLLEQFCEKVQVDTGGKKTQTELRAIPKQRVLVDDLEFTSIIKKMHRTSTTNINETLRNLWDGASARYPTRQFSIEIIEPFCSLLSASTPDALETNMEPGDIADGFLPRCLFIFCEPREPVAFRQRFNDAEMSRLSARLEEITQAVVGCPGEMRLSTQAEGMWTPYYYDLKKYSRTVPELTKHMIERVHLMAMKFAFLYALQARHENIEASDMELGMHVGNYAVYAASRITGHTHQHPIAKEEQRITAMLRRRYPEFVSYRDIISFLRGKVPADTLRRMLTAMVEGGILQNREGDRGGFYFRWVPPEDPENPSTE